jgi:hypothetical protein
MRFIEKSYLAQECLKLRLPLRLFGVGEQYSPSESTSKIKFLITLSEDQKSTRNLFPRSLWKILYRFFFRLVVT